MLFSSYLHASVVNVESKISIPDLEWSGLVVNQTGSDDVEL